MTATAFLAGDSSLHDAVGHLQQVPQLHILLEGGVVNVGGVSYVAMLIFFLQGGKFLCCFQKLILRDLFGTKYTSKISEIINTVGKGEVIRQLQVARDSLVDTLTSGVVTTVNDVKTITAYNNNGNKSGLVVSSDPYATAQAIQNAFNNASNASTLYAPITRGYEYNETTHRYEYTSEPTRAYSSSES